MSKFLSPLLVLLMVGFTKSDDPTLNECLPEDLANSSPTTLCLDTRYFSKMRPEFEQKIINLYNQPVPGLPPITLHPDPTKDGDEGDSSSGSSGSASSDEDSDEDEDDEEDEDEGDDDESEDEEGDEKGDKSEAERKSFMLPRHVRHYSGYSRGYHPGGMLGGGMYGGGMYGGGMMGGGGMGMGGGHPFMHHNYY